MNNNFYNNGYHNHDHNPNPNPNPKKNKPINEPKLVNVIVLPILFVISIASLALSIHNFSNQDTGSNGTNNINISGGGNDGNSANFTEGSIAEVAEKVAPSVVSIVSQTGGTYRTGTAAGTGMIVSESGYILTNKHVVEGGRSFEITLHDGTTYTDVEVVGTDPLNDVAFMKINNGKNLKPVTLGNSRSIIVGQPVIAIGNALGQFSNSVTQGIISGTGRTITAANADGTGAENLIDMIQTDAAINHGNSGGPLVNAAGEVIGINTAISEDGQGVGFAIPISSVKGMLAGLEATGKVERPYLGVQYLNITPAVAKEHNLSVDLGAYIFSEGSGSPIVSGGPADGAGLRNGDIIIAINNNSLGGGGGSLASAVAEYKVGTKITLTIIRGGQNIEISVVLEAYPE